MRPQVSIRKTATYEQTVVRRSIERHLEALGVWEELRPGMKVLLKPNLLMSRRPEEATTTHPALVAALIELLRERDITDITLADSPGGPYSRALLGAIYRTTGMDAAAARGATLNEDTAAGERNCPEGRVCHRFDLIAPVLEADYIISLPKLKTHGMTLLSGAVKNLFGCIPGLLKAEMHNRYPELEPFAGMLLDLCQTVRPNLTIVDAVVGMEGDGPSGGTPRQIGLTLAARNPYALDLVLAALIGLRPRQVPTVRQSIERGLAPDSLEGLDLIGEPEAFRPMADFQKPASRAVDFSSHVPAPLAALARRLLGRLVAPRPRVQPDRCVGCGRCAEACPMHTITIEHRRAVIHSRGCIQCFCCHELCPARAIVIKKGWIR